MRRAALERARTVRTWKAHNRIIHNGRPTGCACDGQPGRFRKGQRIGGCGRVRCRVCKSHKLDREAAFRDYREAVWYRAWAAEYGVFVRLPRKPAS